MAHSFPPMFITLAHMGPTEIGVVSGLFLAGVLCGAWLVGRLRSARD